jgi:serine/tyrosine/threonine adenylyltransferase
MTQLDQAKFDDRFTRSFPGDLDGPNRPRQVHGALYSLVQPTPVRDPRLVAWSDEAGALLGVERPPEKGAAAEILGGNRVVPGMKPFATRYGGHQFGGWAGQLGDGRAMSLGEINGWEVQLKGAGPTPYSRRADGRAVLRSSIREFLCSEIMYQLGVPTTRALSLVVTGDPVIRDMFYDGHPRPEPGAICTRLSPSFVRFGHFELMLERQETDMMRSLLDYLIRNYHPELGEPNAEAYAAWFAEVCRRTAVMIVHWQRLGFVHGVMNTDNMSILGLTIDYGPYGWVDVYDPRFTPNTTDQGGRYAFGQQPVVALWNLDRLASALTAVMPEEQLVAGLEVYQQTLELGYKTMLLSKLGLTQGDDALLKDLFVLLGSVETDMTIFFRRLADVRLGAQTDAELVEPLERAYYQELTKVYRERVATWLRSYAKAVDAENVDPATRKERMNKVNPRIIPRNYLVHEVIERAEQGDYAGIEEMLEAFRTPYDDLPSGDKYDRKRPESARFAPGCSALSCSS